MFFFREKPRRPFLSAVVVAAGSASRMSGVDKQQIMIDEVPVVVRSLEQFNNCPDVDEIVLVCREEALAEYYALVRDYALDKVVSVVKGGEQRQHSVFSGIAACSEQAEYYAIHDGARPLVTAEVIRDCIDAAVEYGAAAAGVRAKDTHKICDDGGFIRSTPDRDSLYAIQTPQIFEAELYRRAMEKARAAGRVYSDDCQLVEQADHPVFVAPGSYENIKITTPEDVAMAQAILRCREEGADRWTPFE